VRYRTCQFPTAAGVRKGNGKLAYAGMPEADREMPELINQAAAWIKSDGIVVDNPELVTARKVCHATYYEPTHRVLLYLL